MYKNASNSYEEGFLNSVLTFTKIYFDDVLINSDFITELKKSGTLFNKDLELGSTPSQCIDFNIHKNANTLIPKEIKVEFGIMTGVNSSEIIPLGIYNLDDYSEKDSNSIHIKAYDNMIKLEANDGYYDASELIKIKGYATLGEIAEDICTKKGLILATKTFLNSDHKVYVYDNTITAREYMGYIAECAGCFVCAGRDGKIYFRTIGEDTLNINQNLFKTYKYSDEYKISKVAYENGIDSFKFGDETQNTLWLNPNNLFITEEQEVQKIYNKMKNFSVYSFEGTVAIDPRVDIGDKINIGDKSIIYQGEITFGGKPRTDIRSKINIKAKSETTIRKPSQKTINRRVQSQIDEAEGKITQLVEETSEYNQKITQVEQDIDSISQKVENIADFTREISSMTQLHLSDTAEGENLVLNLTIYGDTEKFKVLTPSATLVPSNTLVPYGGSIRIVIDTQPRSKPSENAKIFKINIGEPLRNVGDIRDELRIINNKVSIVRRINNKLEILENETVEELGEIILPTYKDNTYIYIKEYSTLLYYCKYIVDNDYLDTFATQNELKEAVVNLNSSIVQTANSITSTVEETYSTKAELNTAKSEIKQTTDNISSTVSKKVGKDEVCSTISQSSDEILLKGNRVLIEADNFKLDKNGVITCTDAICKNIHITSGKIDLTQENENRENPCFSINMANGTQKALLFPNYFGLFDNYSQGLSSSYIEGATSSDYSQIGVYASGLQYSILATSGIDTSGDITASGAMYATGFYPPSKVERKENIEKFNSEALNLINNSEIYSYNYKNDKNSRTIGLIIGKGYKTPKEIIKNNEAINMYSMNSLSWKAIQELDNKIEKLIKILKKVPILGRIIAKRWKI